MPGYKRKRGKGWELQIYKGRNPETGEKEYHSEMFYGTEYQADKKLAEMSTDVDRGEFVEPAKVTFYEYLKGEFLPHILADDDLGTWEDYNGITENHIKNDPLGRMIITKITTREVEAYKIKKLNSDRIDGRPGKLSAKTVKNHIIMIKAAFNYACYLKMFNFSPIHYVKYPKVPKYKPVVFTEEQACRFIEAATDNKLYLYFLLAIYTGMRQGELRGFRWSDVDEKTCLISINQQVRGSGNKARYKDPKTEESVSTVSFDLEFIPLFEEHRRRQMEDMNKCALLGEIYKNNHLVFAGYNGNPLDRKVIVRNFGYICKVAEVPEIRLHDLRHSCATILIASGVHLKTVQERLRHRDIRTTGNIYSHVLPKMQQEANEKMNKVLKFKKTSQG
jgi:integrase